MTYQLNALCSNTTLDRFLNLVQLAFARTGEKTHLVFGSISYSVEHDPERLEPYFHAEANPV